MFKVIRTDNFGRSGEAPGHDELVVVVMLDAGRASQVAALLNEDSSGPNSMYYYKVEQDGYRLQKFSV